MDSFTDEPQRGDEGTSSEAQAVERKWPFSQLQQVTPPTVEQQDWIRNEIDAFVLAKLKEQGLQPAPEASFRCFGL